MKNSSALQFFKPEYRWLLSSLFFFGCVLVVSVEVLFPDAPDWIGDLGYCSVYAGLALFVVGSIVARSLEIRREPNPIERRKARANLLGRESCIIGAVSGSSVFIAGLFSAAAGMSREADAVLLFTGMIVFGGLLLGLPTGISAIVRGQKQLGSIGVALCVVSLLVFCIVASRFMSPA